MKKNEAASAAGDAAAEKHAGAAKKPAGKISRARTIVLLAEGRLVNLSGAEGHPANVMDMSFANQALCAEYRIAHAKERAPDCYDVPEEIDSRIAALKLETLGVAIDTLTEEQVAYMNSWNQGTV